MVVTFDSEGDVLCISRKRELIRKSAWNYLLCDSIFQQMRQMRTKNLEEKLGNCQILLPEYSVKYNVSLMGNLTFLMLQP